MFRHSSVIAKALTWLVVLLPPTLEAQQTSSGQPPGFEEKVDVVATTPLPGIEVPLDQIPAPVQTATSADLDAAGAADLSDFLARRATAVHLNDMQGNPFQADVNYRGFTASPLLGTPQGVSVYMDGVRMNQPFGEVVSWDLIPRIAITSSTLMPGSNPLFGLNTLGGAIVLGTKDGQSRKGTTVQGLYGSALRRSLDVEHGGARADGTLNWYFAGTLFGDDGWRDDSASAVRQVFSKIGWQRGRTGLTVSGAQADNSLHGNGLQELRLLDERYRSVYTRPDITDSRSSWINGTVRHVSSARLTMAGNVYYRYIHSATLNGDINEASLDQSVYQPTALERAALLAAGYTDVPSSGATAANTPFPFWRCLANVILQDEPGEKCNGLRNTTATRQHSAGASAQGIWKIASGVLTHQVIAGGAFDRSAVGFVQSTELGYLAPDRTVVGTGAFADGVSGGEVDGVPFDTRVDLAGTQRTWSAFAADTITIGRRWHLSASARYNRTALDNVDALTPEAGADSLTGSHVFARLNPAVGLTFNPSAAFNAYAGYSEGSRAATSVELGCANPERPCKLPNAMAGDPPLNQVVTRTIESGVRGRVGARLRWNAGLFAADNSDDILFVASEGRGFGYFRNVGRTRRQGLEAGISGSARGLTAGASYTWLDATFRSAETVNGTGNSSNDEAESGTPGVDGTIEVQAGDRIPLIPRHIFKAYGDLRLTSALSIDADLVGSSGAPARGNENGGHQPDGVYYLGPGSTAKYALVDLGARYSLTSRAQLFAQVNNVFGAHYNSAAQLGPTGITPAGTFIARPLPAVNGEYPVQQSTFFAPGAPRRGFGGVRVRF